MKWNNIIVVSGLAITMSACVSSKKYNEILNKEKACNEELERYKSAAVDFESKYKDCDAQLVLSKNDISQLVRDTTQLGEDLRLTRSQYNKAMNQLVAYEQQLDEAKKSGKATSSMLQSQLEAKSEELRRKQELLNDLENELKQKQQLLASREARVNELEEAINRKDRALNEIKDRVLGALKPYEGKGLSVVEKDGKLYVRLEAKLLFASASTKVDGDGKQALIDLAKILENEQDIDIIVEGHTDTDKLTSPNHPRNNWELSVLRATAVVDIMLSNSKMNPKMIEAAGRSEYFPVDVNDKSKNRRIEIIVAPNLKVLFDIISK